MRGPQAFFATLGRPTSGARRIRAPGRSEVSQIRTKRKMKHYPSGHESLFERTTPMKHCPVYIHLSASDDSDLATRTLGDADLQFGYRTPPALGELVIARRQLVAARAKRHGALARTHGDLDALVIRTEAGLLVNESSKAVAAVQNRDQFHGSEAS